MLNSLNLNGYFWVSSTVSKVKNHLVKHNKLTVTQKSTAHTSDIHLHVQHQKLKLPCATYYNASVNNEIPATRPPGHSGDLSRLKLGFNAHLTMCWQNKVVIDTCCFTGQEIWLCSCECPSESSRPGKFWYRKARGKIHLFCHCNSFV